jgi:hypothetical protein
MRMRLRVPDMKVGANPGVVKRTTELPHPGPATVAHNFGRIAIHGRVPPAEDQTHEGILEKFSTETGLPRETVTAHDPIYEAWLAGMPPPPTVIHLELDMPVPANPTADESRTQDQLRAWEEANFIFGVSMFALCDRVVKAGVESSFVTDVSFRFTQPKLEFFIAKHLAENKDDPTNPDRVTWTRIYSRVVTHGREHFRRYRTTVQAMQQVLRERFVMLPHRLNPIPIPQADLETYMNDLLLHLAGKLRLALWQTTCDWENEDYPRLLKGLSVMGSFTVACQPKPVVPREPLLPLIVTPKSGKPKPKP